MVLSPEQIERQDFVDNRIQDLVNDINPSNISVEWDIDFIAQIRELIRKKLVNELGVCNEQLFYPFIEE